MASTSHQNQPHSESLSDESEARRTALQIYREVWGEYFRIEQDSCLQDIHSLEALPPDSHLPTSLAQLNLDSPDPAPDIHAVYTDDESFTCLDFSDETRTHTLQASHVIEARAHEPHPRYESCTPASRSTAAELWDSLGFIPYADDPEFPLMDFLSLYEYHDWVCDFRDPDYEMIEIEAVRRLHHNKNISLEAIDSLRLFRASRISNKSGLIWDVSQRDWPGYAASDLPELPKDCSPQTPNLFLKVNNVLPYFCPSLNCLHMYCAVHRLPYTPVKPVEPRLIGAELMQRASGPCSDSCFKLASNRPDDFDENLLWDADEVEMLKGVLSLTPDSLPCDLAVICAKQCWEVYFYRSRIISDDGVVENRSIEDVRMPFVMPKFVDDTLSGTPRFTPVMPCNHIGACDQNSTCECYANSQHCERNCRCGPDCRIRWKGCKCRHEKGSKLCSDPQTCPCNSSGRECEPGICTRCDAQGSLLGPNINFVPSRKRVRRHRCTNTNVQQGKCEALDIRPGAYGLGAFARYQIAQGAFVGEYVGEMLPHLKMTPELYIHTGMNYCFDLNLECILDAGTIGNETRYLNHNMEPNCEAIVVYVNGEHRITLVASRDIAQGAELFLDYGEKYWHGEGAPRLD